MRLLCFSDLHADRERAAALVSAGEQADLVIGAGDFAVMRQRLGEVMDWLSPLAGKAVLVPGNAESVAELRAMTPARVLHGETLEIDGLRIFGLGYAVPPTPFGSWSCDLTEAEAEQMLAGLGPAEILISHSPPRGAVDRNGRGQSLGSSAVRAAVERAQPRYCLCGHIHDSWGQRATIAATEVLNLGPSVTWLEL